MSVLKSSWSSFSRRIADIYLDGFGHPSERSKTLVASLLKEMFPDSSFHLADFGCGNGQILTYLRSEGISCRYSGYDFSSVLLEAARARFAADDAARFIEADIQDPGLSAERCDIVLYSHVIEMLSSPEMSLLAAKRLSDKVMIRFFEPPVAPYDIAEVRKLDVGSGTDEVPYLRRSMSVGYYNYLLAATGCISVEVHQVEGDRDQIHILHFGPRK